MLKPPKNLPLFIFLLIVSGPKSLLYSQVTFTEVMNNPATSEAHDEYIEIYNRSEMTIDLKGWRIADSSASDLIINFGMGTLLNQNSYAVILDGSYSGNSTTYDTIIPDSVLTVQVDGGTIAGSLSNNSDQYLFLINSNQDTVDRYKYNAFFKAGFSNEKVDIYGPNSSQNWGESRWQGGTPGWRNSLTPYDYDLEVVYKDIGKQPTAVSVNQEVEYTFKIRNAGKNSFSDSTFIQVFFDMDYDSSFSENDELLYYDHKLINLLPEDSISFQTVYTYLKAGRYKLIAEILNPFDQDGTNNLTILDVLVYANLKSLHINEIKFLTKENEPEWIEIFNSGTDKLQLQNWAIADEADTAFIDTFLAINPGQYKVIAENNSLDSLYFLEDSLTVILKGLPSFNNTQDKISLINPLGEEQEIIPYSVDWLEGEEWRKPSLERINPFLNERMSRNWGPSTHHNNATPGKPNSIFTDLNDKLSAGIKISPNPFSPDNDGVQDYTNISIDLPLFASRLRVQIFDIMGRTVTTLKDNAFSGSRSSVIWDGKDDTGRRMRMGIYIVYVQILNDRKGVLRELKKTVVVAGDL